MNDGQGALASDGSFCDWQGVVLPWGRCRDRQGVLRCSARAHHRRDRDGGGLRVLCVRDRQLGSCRCTPLVDGAEAAALIDVVPLAVVMEHVHAVLVPAPIVRLPGRPAQHATTARMNNRVADAPDKAHARATRPHRPQTTNQFANPHGVPSLHSQCSAPGPLLWPGVIVSQGRERRLGRLWTAGTGWAHSWTCHGYHHTQAPAARAKPHRFAVTHALHEATLICTGDGNNVACHPRNTSKPHKTFQLSIVIVRSINVRKES